MMEMVVMMMMMVMQEMKAKPMAMALVDPMVQTRVKQVRIGKGRG